MELIARSGLVKGICVGNITPGNDDTANAYSAKICGFIESAFGKMILGKLD